MIKVNDISDKETREEAVREWSARWLLHGIQWSEVNNKDIWYSEGDKVWKVTGTINKGLINAI